MTFFNAAQEMLAAADGICVRADEGLWGMQRVAEQGVMEGHAHHCCTHLPRT